MEKYINYYYGVNVKNTTYKNNNYYFRMDQNFYCFYLLRDNDNIAFSMEILNQIWFLNGFITIIKNIKGEVATEILNKKYLLIEYRIKANRQIDFFDIINLSNSCYIANENSQNAILLWKKMWRQKLDYYYNSSLDNSKVDIQLLKTYFMCLGECAIQFVEKADMIYKKEIQNDCPTLAHKRIKCEYTLIDFYNPFNIIIDHKSRDIAEYIKSIISIKTSSEIDFESIINNIFLSDYGNMLLISRLIFPTVFFDLIEGNKGELKSDDAVSIYCKIQKYEEDIKKVYAILLKRGHIPTIDWLK